MQEIIQVQVKTCYLVMRSHVESHQPLQEGLRSLVVAEQSVSVHIVSAQ